MLTDNQLRIVFVMLVSSIKAQARMGIVSPRTSW